MVVQEVERDDIEFISKTLGCLPIAHVDSMRPDKLGAADLVQEVDVRGSSLLRLSALLWILDVVTGDAFCGWMVPPPRERLLTQTSCITRRWAAARW